MDQINSLRILAVDDEEMILTLYRDILTPSNRTENAETSLDELATRLFGVNQPMAPPISFDLMTCSRGDEAVEIVKTAAEEEKPFAVVFLDVRMPPGPDGVWTAEKIREIDPNVDIVIVTAFSDISPDEIVRRSPPREKIFYLQKPFHTQEIYQIACALGNKWKTERLLEAYQHQLETRVNERTSDLKTANDLLRDEISKREKTETALVESEERYRRLADSAEEGIAIHDNGRIVDANQALARMFGYNPANLIGSSINKLVPPISGIMTTKPSPEKDEKPYETLGLRKDHSTFNCFVFDKSYQFLDKNLRVTLFRDITHRKSAEEGVRRYASLLEATVESTADGILVVDRTGKIITYNRLFKKMWRIPLSILESKHEEKLLGFISKQLKNSDGFLKRTKGVNTQREVESFDILTFKDGRVFERYSQPQRLGEEIVGRVWSFSDVTKRKRVEGLLRLSEKKYRTLVNNLNIGIYRISCQRGGGFLHANPAIARMFGFNSLEEFLQTPDQELYQNPEEREQLFKDVTRQGGIKSRELRMHRKDGALFWASITASAKYDDQRSVKWIDGVIEDISERKKAIEALRESEEKYRTILDNIQEGYFEVDLDGGFTLVNDSMCKISGMTRRELLSINSREYATPETTEIMRRNFNQLYDTGEPATITNFKIIRRDGEPRTLDLSTSLKTNPQKQPIGFRGVVRDITEKKQALDALRESEERHRTVLETAPDPMVVYDVTGKAIYINPAFTRVFGWTLEEISGRGLDFIPEEAMAESWIITDRINRGETISGIESHRLNKGRELVEVSISGAVFMDSKGKPQGSVITFQDITERKKTEKELKYVAYHDLLTGLRNRKSFYITLEDTLNQSDRRNSKNIVWALLFLDLDRFKQINDTLGHDIGDELLKEVALRIGSCLRKSDHFFRLGGDEFTAILTNLADEIDVAKVARKIREKVALPFLISGHELHITASIGISVFPTDGQEVETLVKNADMAMYAAKEEQHGYRFFTEEMNRIASERMKIEGGLRHAIKRNQLDIHYQSLVDNYGRVMGMEALLRWHHPEFGLIPPGKFIPIAEETGAILPIGEWVLETACRQAKKWQDNGHADLYLTVNLSTRQFGQSDLVDMVREVIEKTGFSYSALKLEVTESSLMTRPEEAITKMKQLRKLGVRFCIDDFGTGYSSLSYLKRLPIDTLKIDRSFVCDVLINKDDQEIIKTIISMAKNLRIETLAEGVETKEQYEMLTNHGCRMMQGFYFGRPMPGDKFEIELHKRSKQPPATDRTPKVRRRG